MGQVHFFLIYFSTSKINFQYIDSRKNITQHHKLISIH